MNPFMAFVCGALLMLVAVVVVTIAVLHYWDRATARAQEFDGV